MSEREQYWELKWKVEKSKLSIKKWIISSQSAASFVAAQEIVRRGKLFTDGENIKELFLKISEQLFSDFKNKQEIVQKIREMPLSAKTVKDIKMAANNLMMMMIWYELKHFQLPVMSQVM